MAKINVSIPDELKQQMDQWPDVNWSKVAQEAFSTTVEINQLKGANMNEEAGIARLRANREQHTERLYAEAFKRGKAWAHESASYAELERVNAQKEALDEGAEINMQDLAEAINDNGHERWDVAAETAEFLFGRKDASDVEVRGFIEGAAEVFNEV